MHSCLSWAELRILEVWGYSALACTDAIFGVEFCMGLAEAVCMIFSMETLAFSPFLPPWPWHSHSIAQWTISFWLPCTSE